GVCRHHTVRHHSIFLFLTYVVKSDAVVSAFTSLSACGTFVKPGIIFKTWL
ncbi:hypothetical protein L9F63_020647, partial [Diploptera punctata]